MSGLFCLSFSQLLLSGIFTCISLACLFALALSRGSEACLLFSTLRADCLVFVQSPFPDRVEANADPS